MFSHVIVSGAHTYPGIDCHQGRKDDIEGMLYMMIHLMQGALPWSKARSENAILDSKQKTSLNVLCRRSSSCGASNRGNPLLTMQTSRSTCSSDERRVTVIQKDLYELHDVFHLVYSHLFCFAVLVQRSRSHISPRLHRRFRSSGHQPFCNEPFFVHRVHGCVFGVHDGRLHCRAKIIGVR